MKKPKQDPLRKFKAEADENLFEDLHFNSRLKERVMQTVHKKPKRFSKGIWFVVNRKKWVMGTAAAAAIISIMVFASSMLQNDITRPPNTMMGNIDSPGILIPPPDGETIDPEWSQIETRILNDFDEAKAWFGEDLLMSGYIPEMFTLKEISGIGNIEGSADSITYEYVKVSKSYYVVQHKVGSSSMIQYGEKVDINGYIGFLSDDETTVLHWFADGVQYVVSGIISKEDALQVARSLY